MQVPNPKFGPNKKLQELLSMTTKTFKDQVPASSISA